MIYKMIRKKTNTKGNYSVYNEFEEKIYEVKPKKGKLRVFDNFSTEKAVAYSKFSFNSPFVVEDTYGNYIKLKGKFNFKRFMAELIRESNCIDLRELGSKEDQTSYIVLPATNYEVISGNEIVAYVEISGTFTKTIYTIDMRNPKYECLIFGMVIGVTRIGRAMTH